MWKWCLEFAARQSHEEVLRQFNVINRKEGRRRLLSLLPFAIAALYLPGWLCLLLMVLDIWLEVIGIRILGDVDPARQPRRYLVALGCFMLSQTMYMVVPALVWQSPDEFAKAFAVGLFLINLVHLSTVRTVHFPLALIALGTAVTISLMSNTWYWLNADNLPGLGISSVCILATAYFTLITMSTVHQLHDEILRDQQAAEVANDAKSRFLAQMSHELRTPLNAILGMGLAELNTEGSADSKDRLTTLVRSARSLSVLLNDILDLSAVQAGQLPIRPVVVDLRAETGATLALFRQQINGAGLALTVTFDENIPAFARLDGQRLRQCLSNILSNAIKYTRTGGISLAVTLPRPDQIALDISDTGPGVDEAMRDQIFEPFQRGDTSIMGTGLGLSISRTLARRMGGDLVLLRSTGGALFRLTFALEAAAPDEVVAPAAEVLADLAGKRVLVVDDIGTNRLVAMTYLRLMGAVPLEAESGEAALALLAVMTPDAILLDMLMPGLDGLATLARIRKLPGPTAAVPVIAMTADATDTGRNTYLAAGSNGYVSKPLSPETLGEAIRAVLVPRSAESDITRRD